MFSMFSFLLSGDGGRKTTFTSERYVFHVYEGTPQNGKFPTKKNLRTSVVLLPVPQNLDHFQTYNEMWKRFKGEQFFLSLGISCMTLAGNNTGLCVFLGKPKFIYCKPLKTTPEHSRTSLLPFGFLQKCPDPKFLCWMFSAGFLGPA